MERLTWRSILTRVGLMAVLIAVLGYLAISLVPGASERLSNATPGWIAVGVVAEVIACAGFAACFTACFRYPPYLVPVSRCAGTALGELAAYAVVPTGLAAPLLRFWVLVRSGMPWQTVAQRSIVQAPLLNVPYVTAALVLGLGSVTALMPGKASVALALAPIGVVLVSVALAAALLMHGRRATPPPETAPRWRQVGYELIRVLPDGLREIPARARNPFAIGGATLFWAGDCAVLWIGFQATGGSPDISVVALAYMLGQLGTWLPLPGGVGGVEPLMAGVLTASGVALGPATAAIVIYRAISLGLQSALGAVAVGLLIPAVRAEARR